MWKYTHTDEMYHSLTGRNNSTELYHSDTYLGQDFSDGIRHWKYIKREMVNGRWKYYYSHDEYNKAKSNYNQAKKASQTASRNYYENQQNIEKYEQDETRARLGKEISKALAPKRGLIKKYKHKKLMKSIDKDIDKAHTKKWEHINKREALVDKELDAYKKERETKSKYEKVAKKTKVQRAVGQAAVKTANKLSDASYEVGKKVRTVKKKADKKIAEGKKVVNKALKKAFPETHTSKTYHGDKVTITKSANGKKVSETTTKNTLTDKVNKRYEKEKQREKKKKKIVKAVKKKLKR